MPRQEIKQFAPSKRTNLYRLIPGQRRHLSLKLLEADGAMSHNALYCNTVPACVNTGRTRSIGTYNDTVLTALVDAKLVKLEQTYRGKQPPVWKENMPQKDWLELHQSRFRRVSSYTITGKGELVLMALNADKMITFHSDGDIKAATQPGEY